MARPSALLFCTTLACTTAASRARPDVERARLRALPALSTDRLHALRGGLESSARLRSSITLTAQPAATGFVQQRLVAPLKALMQRGLTPHTLALSLAYGGACGVFPVPLTTWAVTLLANALMPRLNPIAMQFANSIVTPLMIPLFPLFLHVATLIRGPMRSHFRFADIRSRFQSDGFVQGLLDLREPLGFAVIGWAVLFPVLAILFYLLSIAPARALANACAPVETPVSEQTPRRGWWKQKRA